MKVLKAKGSTGSWFAAIENDMFPCVHEHWVDKRAMTYHDPWIRMGRKQDDEFVGAIIEGQRVLLCEDSVTELPGQPPAFKRKSYTALYEVSDVTCDETGLGFRFTKRGPEVR